MTQIVLSPPNALLWSAFLLDSAGGKQEWLKWRAEADLDLLDDDSLATIPLLSGRLSEWFSGESMGKTETEDPGRNKLLGVCKRAWAQNQLRFRALSDAWTLLKHQGIEPVAIGGSAAWALLYWEEKAVRPISTIDILIRPEHATTGMHKLYAAGWIPELGLTLPEGHVADTQDRVWLRNAMQTSLCLTWRLRDGSAETAAKIDIAPSPSELDLLGTSVAVLPTEELLLDALLRETDELVSWQCDAAVLQRNRRIDWERFFEISRNATAALERLQANPGQLVVSCDPYTAERVHSSDSPRRMASSTGE